MLAKTYNLFKTNQFLQSSSVVFSTNLFIGILNYALVVIASRFLVEQYSLWTAITGFMAILLTPMTGIMTEFTKNASKLDKQSHQDAYNYLQFIQSKAKYINYAGGLIGLIFGSLYIFQVTPANLTITALIVSYSLFNIIANINNQFQLSTLTISRYAGTMIATNFGRFIPTIIFLNIGLGVFALPLGLLSAALVNISSGSFFIKRFFNQHKLLKNQFKPQDYNLLNQFKAASKNIIILLFVMIFFNISPIISEKFFDLEQKDIFAVLYNFGQIIHFGSIAFMSALVAYAARGKSRKIYYTSIAIVVTMTMSIGAFFFLFGGFLMNLFNRPQYLDQIPLIMHYSVFIAFFNIVFVSVQYLLSHSEYKNSQLCLLLGFY
ncbi:hypothetical protein HC766_00635 [Candidatus Gracilibacteria bacterium]|nr:hypothetical protein [Candidatus Gracilibacteria bacterium]